MKLITTIPLPRSDHDSTKEQCLVQSSSSNDKYATFGVSDNTVHFLSSHTGGLVGMLAHPSAWRYNLILEGDHAIMISADNGDFIVSSIPDA